MDFDRALERMIGRYDRRVTLDEADRSALRNLPFKQRKAEANRYLVREGGVPQESSLLVSGFAFRHKLTAEGERQIVSIHIPSDFIDLEGSMLPVADHNVQALTPCEYATVPIESLAALIDAHPRLARAMWIDTLIDGSIYREWVMNVGRRPARERIGHILCEFAARLESVGLDTNYGYELPMTQEQLADAAGLTPVHVNRTLKALEEDRLIIRKRRHILIPEWQRLREISGFNALYLHLDQVSAAAA